MKGQRKGRRRKVFACKKFLATCISPFAGQQDGATKTPSAQNVPGEGSPEWRECTHPGTGTDAGESRSGRQSIGGFTAGAVKAAQPERLLQAACMLLRQGWKPAGLKGPGRDSCAGSVRSMTARPVRPDKFAALSKKQYPAGEQKTDKRFETAAEFTRPPEHGGKKTERGKVHAGERSSAKHRPPVLKGRYPLKVFMPQLAVARGKRAARGS